MQPSRICGASWTLYEDPHCDLSYLRTFDGKRLRDREISNRKLFKYLCARARSMTRSGHARKLSLAEEQSGSGKRILRVATWFCRTVRSGQEH